MCPKESVDYCAFDSTALYTVSTGSSWTLVRDYWTLVHSCTILTQKHLIFKSNLLPKDICTDDGDADDDNEAKLGPNFSITLRATASELDRLFNKNLSWIFYYFLTY